MKKVLGTAGIITLLVMIKPDFYKGFTVPYVIPGIIWLGALAIICNFAEKKLSSLARR